MSIDGTYDITVDSPIGKLNAKLTLETGGDGLSGVLQSTMGKNNFSGGTVNGDAATWEASISTPVGKIKLAISARITGDTISGEVQAGNFGIFPLSGKRH